MRYTVHIHNNASIAKRIDVLMFGWCGVVVWWGSVAEK